MQKSRIANSLLWNKVERRKIVQLLQKGDVIGLISPGSPAPKELIKKGIKVLEQLGFKTQLGKHVFDSQGYLAGSPQDRANDINEFFANPQIKAIIAIRGGYNCNQTLPYLNYSLIKQNPKIFLGLSDVTSILNTITTKAEIITFHGPVLLMIAGGKDGKAFSKYSLGNFKKMLMEKRTNNVRLTSHNRWIIFKQGKAAGKLLGGNLCSLQSILGTPYEPRWKNSILMVESLDERIEMVDQMLTHLKLVGTFEQIKGLLIGRFSGTDKKEGIIKIKKLILNHLSEYNFPIAYGVDFGHTNYNLVLPIGGRVSFNTDTEVIEVIKY